MFELYYFATFILHEIQVKGFSVYLVLFLDISTSNLAQIILQLYSY